LPQLASAKVIPIMPASSTRSGDAGAVLADDRSPHQLDQPVLSAPSALHEEIMGSTGIVAGVLAALSCFRHERGRYRRKLSA